MEVNDLIFKELIKRGYSLEGKTKVWNIADSKLWYLTAEQAKAFLDMEEYDKTQKMYVKKELDLIKDNFEKIIEEIKDKPVNIIDLGCGNGEKAFEFVKNFKDKSKVKYCPIDINEFMIKEAFRTFLKMKGVETIKFKYNNLDFFDLDDATSEIRKGEFKTNVLLLLGGSLENTDMHDLLHDVRNAMEKNDYLLVGNKLSSQGIREIVKYYKGSKYIDNLLMKTLLEIGFDPKEVKYNARFKGGRVEMFYTFLKDKVIACCGKQVVFNEGDKIIVAISYKYA